MKLKLSAKNPRVILDEQGNELLTFTGLHLEDLREIIAIVNSSHRGYEFFDKRSVEI
jgi:hypothetical protein